jgi:hypothetical protein
MTVALMVENLDHTMVELLAENLERLMAVLMEKVKVEKSVWKTGKLMVALKGRNLEYQMVVYLELRLVEC